MTTEVDKYNKASGEENKRATSDINQHLQGTKIVLY